jgi:GH25 family lysozyme M1 (1,4-beta-N-acetylmuramidase)
MWQYSSSGSIPGIDKEVDLNALYAPDGDKLSSKSNFNFEWLTAGSEAGG